VSLETGTLAECSPTAEITCGVWLDASSLSLTEGDDVNDSVDEALETLQIRISSIEEVAAPISVNSLFQTIEINADDIPGATFATPAQSGFESIGAPSLLVTLDPISSRDVVEDFTMTPHTATYSQNYAGAETGTVLFPLMVYVNGVKGITSNTSAGYNQFGVGRLWGHAGRIGLGAVNDNTRFHFSSGTAADGRCAFDGKIAEFISFHEPELSEARRVIIENYLSAKYDIPLISSETPQVWDLTDPEQDLFSNQIAGLGQAADGSAHTDAAGPNAIFRVNSPTFNSTNSYSLWGHNGEALENTTGSGLPETIQERSEQIWKFYETGDVAAATIQINFGALDNAEQLSQDYNLLKLLTHSNTDPQDFSNASIYNLALPGAGLPGGNEARFQNIPITNGMYGTLGQTGSSEPCTDTLDLGVESANSLCDGTALLIDLWLNPSIILPPGGIWTFPNGTIVLNGIVDANTSPSGIYTYHYLDAEGCPVVISMLLNIAPGGGVVFPSNNITVCLLDPPFAPYDSLLGVPASLNGSWIYYAANDDFLLFSSTGSLLTWTLNPADYANWSPMVDGYVVYYSSDPACGFAQDTIYIDVAEGFDAGEFTSAAICEGDSPVVLETLLLGTPSIGGNWEDMNGISIPNLFDPAAAVPDSTYTFIYSGGLAGTDCFNSQALQLTILEITSDTLSMESCESFFWDVTGQTYNSSGFYTANLSCDGTIVLNLSITEDIEAPSITCPQDFQVSVNIENCTATGFYALPSFSDNCSTVELTLEEGLLSGSEFPLGTNLITYRAIDANGNFSTCSFNIEVVDFDPPEISCQDFSILLDENGQGVISINDIQGSSNDLCGVFSESLSQSLFTESDLGVNQVTFTSVDNNGNTSTCISNVEVTSCNVDGGVVTTNDPRLNLCIGDGESDFIVVELSADQGPLGRYGIVESTTQNIVGGNGNGVFNMENYPPGSYFIGHVSFTDQDFFDGVNNVDDLEGCYDVSNLISVSSFLIDGGTISTDDPLVVCVNDGISSSISFEVEGDFGPNFVWAILDQGFNEVLRSNQTGTFDVESLEPGIYKVAHAAYGSGVSIGQVDPQNIEGCVNTSNILTLVVTDCAQAFMSIMPNPTNSQSSVSFHVDRTELVLLEVYDMGGRLLERVYEGVAQEGEDYVYELDLGGYANGIYICSLTTENRVIRKKLILSK
jgi:hypothetical protein